MAKNFDSLWKSWTRFSQESPVFVFISQGNTLDTGRVRTSLGAVPGGAQAPRNWKRSKYTKDEDEVPNPSALVPLLVLPAATVLFRGLLCACSWEKHRIPFYGGAMIQENHSWKVRRVQVEEVAANEGNSTSSLGVGSRPLDPSTSVNGQLAFCRGTVVQVTDCPDLASPQDPSNIVAASTGPASSVFFVRSIRCLVSTCSCGKGRTAPLCHVSTTPSTTPCLLQLHCILFLLSIPLGSTVYTCWTTSNVQQTES